LAGTTLGHPQGFTCLQQRFQCAIPDHAAAEAMLLNVATCFRPEIRILNSQISRLSPNGLESARDQIDQRLGGIGLTGSCLYYNATTLTTFIGFDELAWKRQPDA
jgi:hypothetical protein